MSKKKKEEPDTSKEQAKEPEDTGQSELEGKDDTPEFAAEQSEAMTDLMDDEPEDLHELAKQPAEKDQEQKSQPDEKAEKDAKPEEKDDHSTQDEPESTAKDEVKTKKEEKPDEEPKDAESEKTTTEDDSLNVTYEVIEPDGVKQVPVKNLITTYQQFGNLQKRHTAIKPLFELIDKAKVPVDMLYPYLEVGIAYMQQVQGAGEGKTPDVAAVGIQPQMTKPDIPQQQPGQYQGPFGSADKDEYYKEVDPDLHSAMWTMYNMVANSGAAKEPDEITRRLTALEHARANEGQLQTRTEGLKEIDNRINQWAGPHNDYFSDQSKGNERMEGFKNFIIGRYPDTKISELTPEFLSAVFAAFDPVYYNKYLQNLATQKTPDDSTGTFAESSSVRQAAVKLTEQEQHMADLL